MEMSRTLINLAFATEDVSFIRFADMSTMGDPEIPLKRRRGKLTFLGHFVDTFGAQMMSFDIIAIAA